MSPQFPNASTHSFIANRTTKPAVLVIGGSDSAGLAGIQMDSRCLQSLGVHGVTAVTATTAQNSEVFSALNPVSADVLASQIDSALALKPQAIKIGLLASVEQLTVIVDKLKSMTIPVVLDPIIRTSSQADILSADFIERLKVELLPLCNVVTPNLPEAEQLTEGSIKYWQDYVNAGKKLMRYGVDWVVVKGGHQLSSDACDVCLGPDGEFALSAPKITTEHLRGTGCAFASFIAGAIALGYEIRDALVIAKMALQAGLQNAQSVSHQKGCLEPQAFPEHYWPQYIDADLFNAEPFSALDSETQSMSFPRCVGGDQPATLGLYPIVDSADWLERLLPLGITTAQLRIKELSGSALQKEISRAIALGKQHNCRLFINDYWQIAIDQNAYGVHLGQEDLYTADLQAIQNAGLRLGISSHSHFEVARSRAFKPSYIACGPTFATTTKDMPWVPHGIDGLAYWRRAIKDYPLVSIGGINAQNIQRVASTGVSGVAVITAITQSSQPEQSAQALKQVVERAQEFDNG